MKKKVKKLKKKREKEEKKTKGRMKKKKKRENDDRVEDETIRSGCAGSPRGGHLLRESFTCRCGAQIESVLCVSSARVKVRSICARIGLRHSAPAKP